MENQFRKSGDIETVFKDSDDSEMFSTFNSMCSDPDKEWKFVESKEYKYISSLLMKFMLQLHKIIKEDEKRFEVFESPMKSLSSLNVNYAKDMTIKDMEIATDNMKQTIIESLNRYYRLIRDMDTKITLVKKNNSDLEETLVQKNTEMKLLHKKYFQSDSASNFKSLDVGPINKRIQIQITQLNDEIKSLENEIKELQVERRSLRKDLRNYKSRCDELNDDNEEIIASKKKIEDENKSMKSRMKDMITRDEGPDLQLEISKHEKTISLKDATIEDLHGEINEKDNKINILTELVENLKISSNENQLVISEKEQYIEKLQLELDDLQIKYAQDIEKKNEALVSIRAKMDKITAKNHSFQSKNDELNEQIQQAEIVNKKKQDALSALQDKMKDYGHIKDQLKNMSQLKWQLNSKDGELQNLLIEVDDYKKNLEDKTQECDLLKKEKAGFQEEINNMKLLNFRNKKPEN